MKLSLDERNRGRSFDCPRTKVRDIKRTGILFSDKGCHNSDKTPLRRVIRNFCPKSDNRLPLRRVLAGLHTKLFLETLGKIRGGFEAYHIADFGHGEAFLTE